jgi:hypothetical protein
MSLTSLSKAATILKHDRDSLARELVLLKVSCEFPSCTDQAFSVAEAGVAMFMCLTHEMVWRDSPMGKRLLEKARIAELEQEIWRTVSAAFENPGEMVEWDGTGSLYANIMAAVKSTTELKIKRESLPVITPLKITPSSSNDSSTNASTLATLQRGNEYEPLSPFLI